MRTTIGEMGAQKGGDLCQPTRDRRGLARASASLRVAKDAPESLPGKSAHAKVKPQIDGLLTRVARLAADAEGLQRLLKVRHSLPVGRARMRALSPACRQYRGLVPHLAPQGMVRQPFDLLGQRGPAASASMASTMPGMQRAPPLLQQATVGHLVGEGVLEGVLVLRE